MEEYTKVSIEEAEKLFLDHYTWFWDECYYGRDTKGEGSEFYFVPKERYLTVARPR